MLRISSYEETGHNVFQSSDYYITLKSEPKTSLDTDLDILDVNMSVVDNMMSEISNLSFHKITLKSTMKLINDSGRRFVIHLYLDNQTVPDFFICEDGTVYQAVTDFKTANYYSLMVEYTRGNDLYRALTEITDNTKQEQ